MTNIDCHDILDDFNRLIRIKQLNTNRILLDVGLFFLVVVENARSVITSSFWCHSWNSSLSIGLHSNKITHISFHVSGISTMFAVNTS